MQPQHIAICGNIGSGKTTLAGKLSKHYGWQALLESVEDNPYLRDFYEDMNRWAFHVQMYFLNSRFKQVNKIRASTGKVTVQDRTIYEDAYIFAANLHKSGFMTERDFQSYLDTFHSMISFVQPPDLLIYLKADIPKLVQQIEKRGRDYEYSIRIDYLRNLNEHYESWINNYNLGELLVIDVNSLDFVANIDDFSFIVNKIDLELNSLFS
ncbi:deoxynucleoside kinase [Ohtaekwangia koreensis]|uniref:Deoxyadenosine/deoxycytidine kinase n=1 Tax=Ohtaekwangia koreensis TaxID=688867 RepID=A0A1T5LIF0_9BACT|nr:deoxynucleoside kinase [Ohtaekwangia koreensis]SKC75138.1 Deoxyadenosine/deoxycytidine kinase [Ohtaekwangia koreensis]